MPLPQMFLIPVDSAGIWNTSEQDGYDYGFQEGEGGAHCAWL